MSFGGDLTRPDTTRHDPQTVTVTVKVTCQIDGLLAPCRIARMAVYGNTADTKGTAANVDIEADECVIPLNPASRSRHTKVGGNLD
jgi:hypothetical protein